LKKEEKFNQIVAENSERIKRICAYYNSNAHDQKDIFQEVEMKLNNEIMENQNLIEIINRLKNEDERYAALSKRIQIVYWILLAVILIDAGLSLNTSLSFEFISVQVYFLGAIVLATIIGLLFWRVRYKPLRDAALYLIREINGEN